VSKIENLIKIKFWESALLMTHEILYIREEALFQKWSSMEFNLIKISIELNN